MGLNRQSFRAAPIKRQPRVRGPNTAKPVVAYIGGAILLGAILGIGSIALGDGGIASIAAHARPMAASMGLARARLPQKGDHWAKCSAAREAGTAPIYVGEPGYRPEFDGDNNGVACEPYGA
jgi:hypothetical protein